MFLNHAWGLPARPFVPTKKRTKLRGTMVYALALGAMLAGLCPAPVSAVEPGGIRNILSDRMRTEAGKWLATPGKNWRKNWAGQLYQVIIFYKTEIKKS